MAEHTQLSDEELKSARADLELWRTPQDFFQKVDDLAAKIPKPELFTSPRMGFVRSAMVLADYAKKLDGATSVRPSTEYEEYPDGFISKAGKTLKIEVTEVLTATRKRGDEYKSGLSPNPTSTQKDDAETITADLERAIQKKSKKHYKPKPRLVVYLNVGHEMERSEISSIVDEARRRHASTFETIHVLWNDQLL